MEVKNAKRQTFSSKVGEVNYIVYYKLTVLQTYVCVQKSMCVFGGSQELPLTRHVIQTQIIRNFSRSQFLFKTFACTKY